VLNRAEVVAFRQLDGHLVGAEVRVDGRDVAVDAQHVVNAAGPWVDHVRRLENPQAGTSVRLSRGAHVLVPGGADWHAALTLPQDEVRVTFAVPWSGMLLLGTTESPFDGDPADVTSVPADAEQILREAAQALAPQMLDRDLVRAAYAGLRALPAGEGEVVSARRETVFTLGPGGMLSVAGGKLTTYRRIALEVLERLRSELGLREVDKRPWPLPGASGLESVTLPGELEPDTRSHLLHLYGSLAPEVLEPAREDPALLERLSPDGPDIAAQVQYAARSEWATTVEDVVRRRTTLFYRGLESEATLGSVAELLSR
jgi:glycerol-3-phosphate dehydrogenase